MDQQQPGQTVQPNPPEPNQPEQTTSPDPQPTSQVSPESKWKFTNPDNEGASTEVSTGTSVPTDPITWSAESLIANKKSVIWYVCLAVVAVILAALVYLLTKDKISTGVIIAVAVIFGIFASHHPKDLTYQLDDNGIMVGKKTYNFDSFKSFSVIDEKGYSSIYLIPLQRSMPPLIIYVSPENESQIVSRLSVSLPFAQTRSDPIDSLMRKIHF